MSKENEMAYDQRLADLERENDELRSVIATLHDYIAAPEGDGPIRYIEALALCVDALGGEDR